MGNSVMNDLFDISGKVVVVSGATGVLAGSLARYLVSNGAKVAFLGRSQQKLDASLAKLAPEAAKNCLACVCNVLDRPSLERAKDKIMDIWGNIDVIVNGAGGNMPGAVVPPDGSFFDLDFDQWKAVMDLNLGGTLLPIMVFGKVFEKTGRGVILNFSSMTAGAAVTRVFGYSNAKAAVENLTRWLAVEFAKKIGSGVRVNAIAPGFFISEQNRALLTNTDGSLTQRGLSVISKTPFGRFGAADEINGAAHFLISEASKFVTGQVVAIDGGFSSYSGV